MKSFFSRLWGAIVGAVAGACLGLAITIVLMMQHVALEKSLWATAATAAIGGIVGFVFGNRKIGG